MKKKLTLNVDEGVIQLAKLENLNISNLVEEYLQKYLGANGIEEIDEKIKKIETELSALRDRKKELLRKGESLSRSDDLVKNLMDELQKAYILRRASDNTSRDMDFEWMSSPKNLQRCKLLCKEPLALVLELRKWYEENGKK